ncbi:MAG: histidine kinase dimerization/phospho-acceptor domain-containing protein [Acidobacteriota bacterium]
MHDLYQAPALILTILLVPTFGHLYLRTRDIRNLLWFLAFVLVVIRGLLLYSTGSWTFLGDATPWSAAIAESCALVAAALFLGSLSPLSFRIGGIRVLYAIPFTVPLVLYALLACTVYRGTVPQGPMFWLFPFLDFCSILVGILWGRAKGSLPVWIGLIICVVFGALAVSFYFRDGLFWPLVLAESGTYFLAALLVFSVFRRVSPGVVLSFVGFLLLSVPVLLISPRAQAPAIHLLLLRLIIMAKVATALGLILLALENELAANQAARQREHRARRELESYSGLELSRRRVDEFDRQGDHICETIATHSRFSRVALVLQHGTGIYRLAGAAGFDGATLRALDTLVARTSLAEILQSPHAAPAAENSQALRIDLHPWMGPGDDLERLHFTAATVVPLQGRTVLEGVLLLAGPENDSSELLRHDDLAAIEMLAARMQSIRTEARMLEKLIDSEKFAGIGHMAGNVTRQLNNPLTVILGYAALMEEAPDRLPQDRKPLEAILSAARSMRSTLESLQRVARTPTGQLTQLSLPELLNDMEQLHRSEFLQRSIEFHVLAPNDLPRVLCQPQQLRQAILHCLQFAMGAVESISPDVKRAVSMEAAAAGPNVRITISHTGARFANPETALDPLTPAQVGAGNISGLGLSLCATILSDNNGQATAVNLDPTGAAVILELEAA